MSKCQSPKPTKKVVNWGGGPKAYCGGCQGYVPAHQVPWGQELRKPNGSISASYAAIPH